MIRNIAKQNSTQHLCLNLFFIIKLVACFFIYFNQNSLQFRNALFCVDCLCQTDLKSFIALSLLNGSFRHGGLLCRGGQKYIDREKTAQDKFQCFGLILDKSFL